jgi:hypothetical protein
LGSRKIKQEVLALLAGRDLTPMLASMRRYPAGDAINALFSAICRNNQPLRWHAVSCMGDAVARLAETDMEAARIVMRRFLWSLNDESGGIGWGAPESMAESMCGHAGLAEEYAHLLISYLREDGPEICQDGNYIEHPVLRRGLLWGVAPPSPGSGARPWRYPARAGCRGRGQPRACGPGCGQSALDRHGRDSAGHGGRFRSRNPVPRWPVPGGDRRRPGAIRPGRPGANNVLFTAKRLTTPLKGR